MPLFQQSVLKKYINDLDKNELQSAWQLFITHFLDPVKQANIRNLKEEEYQEGFVRDLFVTVLGYTLNPQPDYNFVLEKKTITDATKSDGAIVLKGEVVAVIELKDTGTPDLDKVSTQAFGYKHKHKNCVYIITSNFEKLRFYINDATDYEEFNLFALSQQRFAVLYLCLQQKQLQNNTPLQLKQNSLAQEENVTKKLYADYSLFKRKLFQNIALQNTHYDKLLLFKKTQKLLDRFLFILFAEDRLLLPPNSVKEILKQWEQLKELDNYVPLYDRFKKYFGYLNIGHTGKHYEIFAYNGGLFVPDDVLDNILVDDAILYDAAKALSNYDFETDVDVNILGHIFEHSLTEIEELQAELEGTAIEKNKTKRKKDGVFYTPRYITKYIVENTVGALCTQQKEALQINEETFAPQKRKANRKPLLEKIDAYRAWLLQLTICDPACGSGAFLNATLEYLIAEHRTADELKARIFGDAIVYTDVENSILENNLFGVDINEDAIEIAKLSLWLRTAKKGRKLSNLNNNIKCGNSLIDDASVGGDKAFKWEEQFRSVFEKGGFDVVIGNPPYVDMRKIKKADIIHFKKIYETADNRINLFGLFVERAIRILKVEAFWGMIIHKNLIRSNEYELTRKLILSETQIKSILNFDNGVFENVTGEMSLLIAEKSKKTISYPIKVYEFKQQIENNILERVISQKYFENNLGNRFNINLNEKIIPILTKIDTAEKRLADLSYTLQGIIAGDEKKFISTRKVSDEYVPIIRGRDISKYNELISNEYIYYVEGTKILTRSRKKANFEVNEKILTQHVSSKIIATYDDKKMFYMQTVNGTIITDKLFSTKYILCLLNSTLIDFYYQCNFNLEASFTTAVAIENIDVLPIKNLSFQGQQPFIDKADIMLSKNKELNQLSQQFTQLLQAKFASININNKLNAWYSLTANEFFKELEKQKIKLPLSQQQEWLQYFEEQKTKANNIQQIIQQTDKEIDKMVYALYELSDDEVKIIETAK